MVKIDRFISTDQGTFGKIHFGRFSLFTLELPWRNNQMGVSCIPTGEYHCTYAYSPKFTNHYYRIQSVPGRTGIIIHPANFGGDRLKGFRCELEGCIALGMELDEVEGQMCLYRSKDAVQELQREMKGADFLLKISQTEEPVTL